MKISLRIILIGVCCSLLLTANHESLAALQPEEEALINVFEKVSPAVVFIKNAALQWDLFSTDLYEIPQGAGSGFIWDDQGHVITNFHVIYQADKIEVILNDQKSYEAKVIGISPDHDLAVLKINAPTQQLKSISIGSSKGLKVGQKALSIGNPFGLDHSLTTGVVSALGRSMNSIGGRKIHNVIQTDAAINPGNSGGPLLDSSGNLIGVSTSIYSPSGAYAGVGFAIPVDIVKRVVPQLIKYGRVKRAGLGVVLVPDNIRKRAGVKKGAMILDIQRKSASDQAGLQATRRNMLGNIIYGDVIVVVDKQPIESNEDLVTYLETKNEGEKINLKFMRGTKEYGTTVILQEIRR
ncbi:HtrA protease/chaperone protein [hydrothermal vent metagenome]|uniref:HtrA protease/chaperone protein n=1 Tax=hydrothermal vent metagenome TaxID=652676 RepID=A0A3B1E1Q8_9ZZZZ